VTVLLDASRKAAPSHTAPVVLADAELKFSNSVIEAWWRSLKHQSLFLHSLDVITTVRRLVAFYVDEHNRVLPHSAFRG
jgi:putative transposase